MIRLYMFGAGRKRMERGTEARHSTGEAVGRGKVWQGTVVENGRPEQGMGEKVGLLARELPSRAGQG